jgi:hypothetical protein
MFLISFDTVKTNQVWQNHIKALDIQKALLNLFLLFFLMAHFNCVTLLNN